MCKKKVAGVALVVTAMILLTLGIVLGLLLPNLAQKAVKGRTCVDSKDSPGYKTWVGPAHSTTRVYIWNITNKDGFLYRQEKPKFVETGPYVYSTTSKNINVKFQNGRRTSKSFAQSKYNKSLTEKECPTCGGNDQLTVLNSAYLGLMAQAQSAMAFSLAFIPLATNLIFSEGDSNTTLLQLGSLRPMANFTAKSIPAFGSWINSNPHFTSLLTQRDYTNFTVVEMSGLYSALKNVHKFGFDLRNATLVALCSKPNTLPTKECGLLKNLVVYSKLQVPNASAYASIKQNIDDILCGHPSQSCFKSPSNNESLSHLYRLAVGQFVLGPLRKSVLRNLDASNYGLTTTRGQRDLAIGYVMNRLKFPPLFPNGVPVPGPVTSHRDEDEAEASSTNSSFYTCDSTEGKPFTWAAYGGESKVRQEFFPNANSEQLTIKGYYSQYPGQKLKACSSSYSPSATSYEIFLSLFYLTVPITYKEDVELHDIPMHRYSLDEAALEVNNVTVFTRGLFDVSKVLQGPIYASLPRFLYGDHALKGELDLPKPEEGMHGSFVDIEPISGSAMQLKLRIQLNGIISNTSVDQTYPGHRNVTYLNKPIPILWTELEATIDPETAKMFGSKLYGTLRLSCGVIVALPVIGGILLLIGGLLIVLAMKKSETIAVA